MTKTFFYMTSALVLSMTTSTLFASSDVPLLMEDQASQKSKLVAAPPPMDEKKEKKSLLKKGAGAIFHVADGAVDKAAGFTANHLLTKKAKNRVESGKSAHILHNIVNTERKVLIIPQVTLPFLGIGFLATGNAVGAGACGLLTGAAAGLALTSSGQEALGNKWLKKLQKAIDKGNHDIAATMISDAQNSNLITVDPVSSQSETGDGTTILSSIQGIVSNGSEFLETAVPIVETIIDKIEDRVPEGGTLATVLEKISPVMNTVEDFLEGRDKNTSTTSEI